MVDDGVLFVCGRGYCLFINSPLGEKKDEQTQKSPAREIMR